MMLIALKASEQLVANIYPTVDSLLVWAGWCVSTTKLTMLGQFSQDLINFFTRKFLYSTHLIHMHMHMHVPLFNVIFL